MFLFNCPDPTYTSVLVLKHKLIFYQNGPAILTRMETSRSGFVLAGGKSSRMGRDKALLPFRGRTLVEAVAAVVAEAAGRVTLIGDPQRHGGLGLPVVADRYPGCGPLAGIHAALALDQADWNLVAACDMPELTSDFLRSLLEAAEAAGADCLLPKGSAGLPEPLCAVYHRRSLEAIQAALDRGVRKVTAGLQGLRIASPDFPEAGCFRNLNTSEEWTYYQNG
jgi:molybdenum cofactor guanylyltransferase